MSAPLLPLVGPNPAVNGSDAATVAAAVSPVLRLGAMHRITLHLPFYSAHNFIEPVIACLTDCCHPVSQNSTLFKYAYRTTTF